MIELEDNSRLLNSLKEKIKLIEESLKVPKLKEELAVLEKESLEPEFWNDQENSSKVFAKIKNLKRKIEAFEKYNSELENLLEMNDLLQIDYDKDLAEELINNSKKLEKSLENLEIETLLSGKFDSNNAIITLHPGAGRNRVSRLGTNAL